MIAHAKTIYHELKCMPMPARITIGAALGVFAAYFMTGVALAVVVVAKVIGVI
jgi:hypothetical protein